MVAHACKGSFDFASGSLRDPLAALRMTNRWELLTGTLVRGADPDAVGGGRAEGDGAGGGGEGDGLVVVTFEETQFRSGTNAAGFEKFEKAAIAFVDSADGVS